MKKYNISRRRFLKKAAFASAAAIGFPYIVSSSALGKAGFISAGNRVTMGCIGIGWQGESNMKTFLNEPDLRVLAVCDIDKNHLKLAKQTVDEKYHNNDCTTYHDFREIIARDDIDTMLICLPDHWHCISAVTALRAGKDVYGEKPISHKLAQGRAICNAVKKYNRVWQTGSWQRSVRHFRFGCELVRNGRIGKVKKVDVLLPTGHTDFDETSHQKTPIPVPDELDYDFWLGPAPYKPYTPARVHKNWRWIMDYGGGQLTDWIGHHADIGLWGLGMSGMSPVEVEATGRWVDDILWDTPVGFNVTVKYANGVVMNIWDSQGDGMDSGTIWHGETGRISVTRKGIDIEPKELLRERINPDDVQLYNLPSVEMAGHHRNFIDCVKTRSEAIAPAEAAHRAVTPAHLGLISMQLGRKLCFDPGTEQVINDPTANRLLDNSARSPWHL